MARNGQCCESDGELFIDDVLFSFVFSCGCCSYNFECKQNGYVTAAFPIIYMIRTLWWEASVVCLPENDVTFYIYYLDFN